MLSVRWEQHEAAVRSHLFRYFCEEAFVDVVVSCAGRRFKAHRAVLSACSAYLERLLREHPRCAGEPVTLVLHGVEAADTRRLLQLVYRGQARLPAAHLPRLLDAAAALGLRLLQTSALRVHPTPRGELLYTEVSYPQETDEFLWPGGSAAALPPPPPPPAASPPPTAPAVDWSQVPLQTQLPGATPLLERLQLPPTEPDPAPRRPGETDTTCSTPASAPQPDAMASMAAARAGSLNIPNPPVSRSEEMNGSRLKPDEEGGSIHCCPQTRVAPWEKQPRCFSLETQVELRDGSSLLGQRPVAVASCQEQTGSPLDASAEPLPPEPDASELSSVCRTAGDRQDDGCSDARNGEPACEGGGGPLLQSRQPPVADAPGQRVSGENAPSVIPETKSKTKKENICEICCKNFSTRYSLKVHGRTHTGEKPHRCEQCGQRFSQRRNYRYHLSLHAGSREFEAACPDCGKVVSDRAYLAAHRRIHRDRREFACALCGRRFNQRAAWAAHARAHADLRPHRCADCGRAFSRKSLLRRHARRHAAAASQPFPCQECGRRFADAAALALHGRLHAAARPHRCARCGCSFLRSSQLRAHLSGACAVGAPPPPPTRVASVITSTAAAPAAAPESTADTGPR